jgi:hypothetical protein
VASGKWKAQTIWLVACRLSLLAEAFSVTHTAESLLASSHGHRIAITLNDAAAGGGCAQAASDQAVALV